MKLQLTWLLMVQKDSVLAHSSAIPNKYLTMEQELFHGLMLRKGFLKLKNKNGLKMMISIPNFAKFDYFCFEFPSFRFKKFAQT